MRIQKYLRVLVEYADVVEPEITRRMIEPPITYHWLSSFYAQRLASTCVTDTEVLVSRRTDNHADCREGTSSIPCPHDAETIPKASSVTSSNQVVLL